MPPVATNDRPPMQTKKPGYNFRAPLINLLRFICGLQNVAGNKSCDYTRKGLHELSLQPTQKKFNHLFIIINRVNSSANNPDIPVN
jgi:hypothetical protein